MPNSNIRHPNYDHMIETDIGVVLLVCGEPRADGAYTIKYTVVRPTLEVGGNSKVAGPDFFFCWRGRIK